MKKILAVMLLLAMLLSFSACKKNSGKNQDAGNGANTATEKADAEKTGEEKDAELKDAEEKLNSDSSGVAIIGDVVISQEYYNCMYMSVYKSAEQTYAQQYGENWIDTVINGKTLKEHIKLETEERLKILIAENIVAEDYGLFPENEDIKQAADEMKKALIEGLGGQEEYEKYIQERKSSDEAVTKYILQAEIQTRVAEKFQEEYDAKAKEDALNEFNNSMFKVQYVFISTEELIDGNGNTTLMKSDSEAQFVANTVIERLNSGEDFGTMVDSYNEDAAMMSDSYHLFSEDTVQEELFAAAKNLAPGEYTKTPIASNSGYYVIKRYPVDENDENFIQYYGEESLIELDSIIQEKIKDIPVIFKYDVIDPYINSWLNELKSK